MDVYIPHLEIPTSCFDCPVAHPTLGNLGAAILGCPLIGKTLSAPFCEEKRMDNCPLVPVPPHGRLIDENDALEAVKQGAPTTLDVDALSRVLFDCPTIIPADSVDRPLSNVELLRSLPLESLAEWLANELSDSTPVDWLAWLTEVNRL